MEVDDIGHRALRSISKVAVPLPLATPNALRMVNCMPLDQRTLTNPY